MIRLISAEEANASYKVLDACRRAMQDEGLDQWYEDYPSKEIVLIDIAEASLYGYWLNEELVAVMTIDEKQADNYGTISWTSPDNERPIAVIHRLGVHPVFQRQGIARELMDFAENDCRKKGYFSIRLDTYSINQRNIRFYTNRAYKLVGQVHFEKRQYPFVCFEKVL